MRTRLFIIALLLLVGCKKDSVLPEATESGENTFGCYLNSNPFIASTPNNPLGPAPISAWLDASTMEFTIQATRKNDNGVYDDVRFRISGLDGVGIYNMAITGDFQLGYSDYAGESCTYYHDPANPGSVEITMFDPENQIISGTFSMILINSDCQDETLSVTEGRFDCGYAS